MGSDHQARQNLSGFVLSVNSSLSSFSSSSSMVFCIAFLASKPGLY